MKQAEAFRNELVQNGLPEVVPPEMRLLFAKFAAPVGGKDSTNSSKFFQALHRRFPILPGQMLALDARKQNRLAPTTATDTAVPSRFQSLWQGLDAFQRTLFFEEPDAVATLQEIKRAADALDLAQKESDQQQSLESPEPDVPFFARQRHQFQLQPWSDIIPQLRTMAARRKVLLLQRLLSRNLLLYHMDPATCRTCVETADDDVAYPSSSSSRSQRRANANSNANADEHPTIEFITDTLREVVQLELASYRTAVGSSSSSTATVPACQTPLPAASPAMVVHTRLDRPGRLVVRRRRPNMAALLQMRGHMLAYRESLLPQHILYYSKMLLDSLLLLRSSTHSDNNDSSSSISLHVWMLAQARLQELHALHCSQIGVQLLLSAVDGISSQRLRQQAEAGKYSGMSGRETRWTRRLGLEEFCRMGHAVVRRLAPAERLLSQFRADGTPSDASLAFLHVLRTGRLAGEAFLGAADLRMLQRLVRRHAAVHQQLDEMGLPVDVQRQCLDMWFAFSTVSFEEFFGESRAGGSRADLLPGRALSLLLVMASLEWRRLERPELAVLLCRLPVTRLSEYFFHRVLRHLLLQQRPKQPGNGLSEVAAAVGTLPLLRDLEVLLDAACWPRPVDCWDPLLVAGGVGHSKASDSWRLDGL